MNHFKTSRRNVLIGISCNAIIFLTSCTGNNKPAAGGPCSYSINHWMAEVISIDSMNTGDYDMKFIVSGYKLQKNKDTFSYHELYDRYISRELFQTKHIHIGQKIPYRVDIIEQGTCSPVVTQMLFDSLKENTTSADTLQK